MTVTSKQQLVYNLRPVTDALEELSDRIAQARSEWVIDSRLFKDDTTIYQSTYPNDKDGFPESDIYLLMKELIDLQDVALDKRLSLARRVGMV